MNKYTNIEGRKIKFAIVGCGRISVNHINALKDHSNECELIAACDTDESKLKHILDLVPQVKLYNSLTNMLSDGGFDAVIIATPSGLHCDQTIECADNGFHVITEKPMATKYCDGVAMVKACDKANVRLFVVKQNRKNATIQLLKKAIKEGRFGRIYNVACNVFWTRPQSYYDMAIWRGTWEFDGGAFMNQASHYVDLLDWLIGPVESVQSYVATLARDIEVEDSGVVAIRWRSGAMGTMNVSMLTYPKNYEGSLTIIGENGTVRLGGVAINQIEHWEFLDYRPEDKEIKIASYATTSVYGLGHPLYYDNVIKTLRGIELAQTDGRSGLHSLELLTAIYLSARDGERVCLPLEY